MILLAIKTFLALMLLADCYSEWVNLRMTCWSFATEAKVASLVFMAVKLATVAALFWP